MQIAHFLAQQNINRHIGIVVGVSTGLDSMALLHAFMVHQQKIVVAHVHHGKRAQSDAEALFIEDFCKLHNLPFAIEKLNPTADIHNFQDWARKKRYAFFNQVAATHGCTYIATAHHQTDKFENFFMYALRGSGLAGLSGLRALQGNIIRPILGYTRPEIESYAVANKITWFEDDSNETDDYTRNRIRHHILPALPLVDERWAQGLQTTQNNVEVSLGLLRETVELWKNNNVVVINDEWHLSLAALAKIENRETLIHFLMADVDASLPANALANCINDAVGSKYIGHTHEALRDRENLIIRKKLTPEFSISTIDENTSRINFPVDISFEIKSINDFTLGQIPQTEAFDFDKLTFPLVIRQWQQGDKFRPLGMSGMKKVSDYLTDAKMNRFNKENTFVLTSAGEIVWLIGLRIDDRYKVETTTRLLYLARLEKPLL